MTGAGEQSALLTVRHLRKRVGRRLLLDVDELSISPGTCLLLTGRNGVGKTTLLKIIAGLEKPDAVEMTYAGQTLTARAARQRCQRNIIYLHQHPYLFDASVRDNIAYGLHRAGQAPEVVRHRVAQALEWAGLAALAGRNAWQLSGGEKQRVALTRAWVLSPRILLLDEPVASMDQEARQQTFFLISRLKSEGVGLVITGHDVRPMVPLVDTHLVLRDGHLVAGQDLADASARSRPAGPDAPRRIYPVTS